MILSHQDRIMPEPSRLAQLRQRRGWTQADLAARCGASRAEISAIETGRLVPSVAVAVKVARALGEPVEGLFGATDEAPPLDWAWPGATADPRVWQASLNGRRLVFPVEPTAAGAIPHDGRADGGALHLVGSDAGAPERTLVVAGCDPLVGFLVRELAAAHGIRVLPLLRSSAHALELLRRGLVHVAGLHYTDADGHSTNSDVVRDTLGPGYRLIHQLRWEAGIAVWPRRRERTPRALLRAGVRWVNREEGSAARRVFDTLLAARRRPSGYHHVVGDHRAVAATVSSGWAEAGPCVKPAAAEAQLGFIPLQQEAYELSVAEAQLDDPRVRALLAVLQSSTYRGWLQDVPGCDSAHTGDVRRVA
jgi:molybdate-binding protein/transcriptional regulator with XRE-family HTH domain